MSDAHEPKVTIGAQTASAEILAEAKSEHVVIDARGRKITLAQPSFLIEWRLMDVIGPERAQNGPLAMMANMLLYVSAIDGQPVPAPSKYVEIEALVRRLDRDGYKAVAEGVTARWADLSEDAEKTELKK